MCSLPFAFAQRRGDLRRDERPSHHLPATCERLRGGEVFHSSLFFLLLLFEACSWLLHPGGNCLEQNKMKSHPMTLCQLFNRAVIYSSSCFHVLFPSFQTARCCLPAGCCGRTVHDWSHVTHNVMTVSLNNVSIIEGDGSGDRNSGNEKTVSLFLCPI